MQTPPPCCGGVGEQRINYIILFDIFVLLSQRFVLRIVAIAIRYFCPYLVSFFIQTGIFICALVGLCYTIFKERK